LNPLEVPLHLEFLCWQQAAADAFWNFESSLEDTMRDERLFLKIKIKSLAAEARIIRHHEKKERRTEIRDQLVFHRRLVVRRHTRMNLLAYGFIRGRKYRQIEAKVRQPLRVDQWREVEKIVKRFSDWTPEEEERFGKWKVECSV
jgi:hypothetical protein